MDSVPNVPRYPGMQQVQQREGLDGVVPTLVTTFVTSDQRKDVVSFYREKLQKSGWSYVPLCDLYAHQTKLYTAHVQAASAKDGQTVVDVKLIRSRLACNSTIP